MAFHHLLGCLLGTAVGDALGLAYEGLSRTRAARMLGPPERYRLLFGRGMISDDTEHTCMVGQSLLVAGGDVSAFRKTLAWRFRWWLLGQPAGIGLATLRSILRLWIGFGPERSGVFSAGNGPAMRAAILGAAIDDLPTLREFIRASTRITHVDPKAEFGAWAVALAARCARTQPEISSTEYLLRLAETLGGDGAELIDLLGKAQASAQRGDSTEYFADSLGLTKKVTGYVYHSVPVAIHAWFLYGHDYRAAIRAAIRCGGDTDTTAAIVGGVIGTAVGKEGIPPEYIDGLLEWPRSVAWMERLAQELDLSIQTATRGKSVRLPIWGIVPRNLLFLAVILFHGFRRLFPPY